MCRLFLLLVARLGLIDVVKSKKKSFPTLPLFFSMTMTEEVLVPAVSLSSDFIPFLIPPLLHLFFLTTQGVVRAVSSSTILRRFHREFQQSRGDFQTDLGFARVE